jgi:hypothetical protein
LLPSSEGDKEKFAVDQPLEVFINVSPSGVDVISPSHLVFDNRGVVRSFVGTVVNGILNAGSVKTGDIVLLGPDANGNYQSVVKSMQRKRLDITNRREPPLIFSPISDMQRRANVFLSLSNTYDALRSERAWCLLRRRILLRVVRHSLPIILKPLVISFCSRLAI